MLIKTGGDLDPVIAGMVAATAIILGRKEGLPGRPAVLIARPDKVNATVPKSSPAIEPARLIQAGLQCVDDVLTPPRKGAAGTPATILLSPEGEGSLAS